MATEEERIRSWSMESHRIKSGARNYPEVREVVLIVGEEKNRGEWKKGRILRHSRGQEDVVRGLALQHKGHTIERPLNLICSLENKGPVVVGTASTTSSKLATHCYKEALHVEKKVSNESNFEKTAFFIFTT